MKIKRFIPLVIFLLFLTACSDDELDNFVNDFNQNARKYDAVEIKKDEFGEMEYTKDLYEEYLDIDEEVAETLKESKESSKALFESKEYKIDSLYDNKKHTGYYISVNSDTNSIDKTGKGYSAILTLADTLNVDINRLEREMQSAFNSDNLVDEYEDEEYNVRISVINVGSASISITFEKK